MKIYQKKTLFSLLASALAAILLSCLLIACGTGSSTGSTPPTATSTTAPSATTTATAATDTPLSTVNTPAAQPGPPLTAIRMLDLYNGWALSNNLILRTSDGGLHWRNLTPAGATVNVLTKGDFLSSQVAWIATPNTNNENTVTILRTVNGGQNWSSFFISVPQPTGLDVPHFINLHEGWIEIITNGGPGAGNESVDIWHSVDGGTSWQRIASTDQPSSGLTREGFKSGISFRDALNGWATTGSDTGRPANPGLFVTHDGGKTWQIQNLPLPKGQSSVEQMGTTPPVFFGNEGLLPVQVTLTSTQRELVLYATHDGGQTWTPTNPAQQDSNTVYVIDPQHAWTSAVQTGAFLYTINGGQSWTDTKSDPGPVKAMSFADSANGWAITDTMLLRRSDNGLWKTVNYSIN
jgi:photosystem II stability/assembly factor-like uncharacterized protein